MKPMLAFTVEDVERLKYPVLASPKLDGIRCLMIDGKAYSRNMKLIPNAHIQEVLRGLHGLDGELIVGDPKAMDCFNKSTSGVMSRDGNPKFQYWVFDHWELMEDDPFDYRLSRVLAAHRHTSGVSAVAHKLIANSAELLRYEAQMLIAGFEGVMVRDPAGLYKQGRSTAREGGLGKLKRFTDSEAVITGFVEQMENTNELQQDELGRAKRSSHKAGKKAKDTLGAIEVRDIHNGVSFEIGTGFDDDLRKDMWTHTKKYHGQIVKYKSQPVGAKDKPRFPVFLGFRDKIDL